MIAITIDVDWAPDEIVKAVVQPILDRDLPVTLFCTNPGRDASGQSSSLNGKFGDQAELGWHPNFSSMQDVQGEADQLAALYPQALGWKSHNGLTGWPMQQAAMGHGLGYEILPWSMPCHVPPYAPYSDCDYLLLHNHFMDAEALKQNDYHWDPKYLHFLNESNHDNLFILTFHPAILFYDMACYADYLEAKSYYHEPNWNRSFLGKVDFHGAMGFLRDLLNYAPPDTFTTPGNYVCKYRDKHPIHPH